MRTAWATAWRVWSHWTRDARIAQLASPNVHSLSYAYNINDTLGIVSDDVVPALNTSFGYSATKRLNTVSRSGDAQAFGWDINGNRINHTRQGLANTYATAASSNRLLSISGAQSRNFGYDANGNVLSDVRSGQFWSYGLRHLRST